MKATIEELMDRYEIGEILGTGAFSEVKVGRKKETGETFALKIIDRAKCRGKESMIETEVGILAKVRHDNIVQLYEMYEIDTKIYLVMQIVTGGELFDDIVKRGKYTEADASRIVHKILDAVDYLHEMGIAHRDLKPENLLLSDRSSNPRIMLSDFGLSKIFNEDEVMRTACGTPGYVAPEVLRKKGYGKEVDLWSIGVISYILLCGYPPFYDQNNAVLFRQIMAGRYEFDRPWWDNVSEEAKDFIRHLLVLDPRQRYTAKQALGHPFIARERDSAAGWSQTGGAATSSGDSGAIRTESTGKGKAAVISCAQEEKNLAASVTQHLAARANSKNEGKANSAKSVERSEDIGRPISERRDLDDSGCVRSNNDVSQKKAADSVARASVPGQSNNTGDRLSTQSAKTAVYDSRPTSIASPAYGVPRSGLATRVRFLSYNIFLRPPGIKNNVSDHKNARLHHFGSNVLAGYDIVCLQEMFQSGSNRLSKMLSYAKKAGLEFHYASPSKGLLNTSIDGGLLILSRYPIVKTDKITFKRGIYGDRYAAKGAIYAKVNLTPTQSIHVFNTHLQSSAMNASMAAMPVPASSDSAAGANQHPNTPVGGGSSGLSTSNGMSGHHHYSPFSNHHHHRDHFDSSATTFIRLQQITALKEFIDEALSNANPAEPAILAADMNVNARATRGSGKKESDEYTTMMRLLRGEVVLAGSDGQQPQPQQQPLQMQQLQQALPPTTGLSASIGISAVGAGATPSPSLPLASRPPTAASSQAPSGTGLSPQQQPAGRGKPLRLHVKDIVYEASGEHAVTFGDVVDATANDYRPTETVLTPADGIGACGAIDYIFWMERTGRIKAGQSSAATAALASADIKSSRIEKFLVEGEPFTQLSDHYGLSTSIHVMHT